tara:strand:+ start:941 stop:1072 length:132 start_codon:yes stop_codon:yes gene_type:complete
VHIKDKKSSIYHTFGPYHEEKAIKLMHKYLSTGICSWVEEVES